MKFRLFLLLFLLSPFALFGQKNQNYVVMLSLDGFRWDYPQKAHTPTLDSIARHGVKAQALHASFPTKTFPNHYSIATGLYPDHHGIVLNSFYAPQMNAYYKISNRQAVENPDFYGGEPIWATAEKQGLVAASFYWVGSEAIRPTYWKRYDQSVSFQQRIDTVIAWLQKPEPQRPRLILWYYHQPDKLGHQKGPDSPQMSEMISYLDSMLTIFMRKIRQLPHADKINIIVTADHGMGNISKKRRVVLNNYVQKNWFCEIQGSNPVLTMQPKTQFADTVYSILKNVEHIQVWKKQEIPRRLHFGSHRRVLALVVAADSAWSVGWRGEGYSKAGTHGYDNQNPDMNAIFYAIGPVFAKNHTQKPFSNVDIYNLICRILHLKPAPNDGKFHRIKDIFDPAFLQENTNN